MKKILLFTFAIFLMPFAIAQQYGWMKIDPASINGNPSFTDVFFTDAEKGWITTSTTGNIYRTDDGAASFSTQTTPLGPTNAIHMLNGNIGYSGGQGGWIYNTSDGGLNWSMLATMSSLIDISFPFNTDTNNPIGYACGDAGRVWEITSTLTDLNSPSASDFGGISAPSVNNVWVCGGNRIYYYNGTDFTSQIAPTATFNDIHFINNQEGWVVGDLAVIGHTEDGGVSWITQTNPDPQNRSLYGIFFIDSNNGWAVGADGIILHTLDGGTNWIIEAEGITTSFLRGVHFTSLTNGYVVGNERTLLKYGELMGIADNDLKELEFYVYPNPCDDNLIIKVQSSDFKVQISDFINLKGKTVKSINIQGQENTIDVSDLPSGVYFIKLQTEEAVGVRKIIIR